MSELRLDLLWRGNGVLVLPRWGMYWPMFETLEFHAVGGLVELGAEYVRWCRVGGVSREGRRFEERAIERPGMEPLAECLVGRVMKPGRNGTPVALTGGERMKFLLMMVKALEGDARAEERVEKYLADKGAVHLDSVHDQARVESREPPRTILKGREVED